MPNKIISLDESCLLKAAKILEFLEEEDSVQSLYELKKNSFFDISEYIDALDLLFALGKINVNYTTGVINIA
ncbi:ABC-three component system middle component 7 [Pseudomonas sp. MYb115]|nr:hypothetical protein CQZ98_17380 [Pseudomonas sp. MYb115]